MPDYQKMYKTLFNEVSDTIERLQQVQQQTEELYMSEQEPVWLAEPTDKKLQG